MAPLQATRRARFGRAAWFNLDPITIARLGFAQAFSEAHLEERHSTSTLVRRAVQFYASHLGKLNKDARKAPSKGVDAMDEEKCLVELAAVGAPAPFATLPDGAGFMTFTELAMRGAMRASRAP